jgi:allophanate hydrolase
VADAWTIAEWTAAYRGGLSPLTAMTTLAARCVASEPDWILCFDAAALQAQAQALLTRFEAAGRDWAAFPLFGVPFVVKDNLDVAGVATTAACPDFAYVPTASAPVVARLIEAGALLLGKANLDQFATGLVGTRSPYGAVPNAFNPDYVSGGSSSGSATLVARGIAAFSLGTDTAGSGRVPAAFNNLVGLKPTRGWFSTRGVVPACRSLDCVSVFAHTLEDAEVVAAVLGRFDAEDPFARPAPAVMGTRRLPPAPRLGVPAAPRFCGDAAAEAAFGEACSRLEALGATLVPLDFAPLHALADLLYEGPWVAERQAAISAFLSRPGVTMHPVVQAIIGRADDFSAADAFRADYHRAELVRAAEQQMASVDALVVPSTPTIHTQAAVAAEPVLLNTQLGTYTNFVNLMDGCALALPTGFRGDGLPTGVTLIAPAWHDIALLDFGRRWQRAHPWPLGVSGRLPSPPPQRAAAPGPATVRLAVVGAHLSGMPLNYQLTERAAVFVEATQTADDYRLYALPGTVPPKPGLIRGVDGAAIQVELWDMPVEAFGSFVALIPAPLGIGTLQLADGREVKGFICESWAATGALDITHFGGWRAYMAHERARAA